MSYGKTNTIYARNIRSGLSGASDCGPNQQWDPNAVYPGLPPGQCTPRGSAMTAPPAGGGSGTSVFDDVWSKVFGGGSTPPPGAYPPGYMPPASGMSSTEMLLIGGLAIGALLLIMRK